VRRGAKEASVAVEFVHNDVRYCVGRTTGGDYNLYAGEDQVAKGKRDVQVRLRSLFHLSDNVGLPALYSNAIGVPQGTLTAGFDLSEKARLDWFGPVLGLDQYREAWAKLRPVVTELKNAEFALRAAIEQVDSTAGMFESDTVGEANVALSSLTEEAAGLVENMARSKQARDQSSRDFEVILALQVQRESMQSQLDAGRKGLDNRIEEKERAESRIDGLELVKAMASDGLEQARAKIDNSVRERLLGASSELATWNARLAAAEKEVSALTGQVVTVDRDLIAVGQAKEKLFDAEMRVASLEIEHQRLSKQREMEYARLSQARGSLQLIAEGQPCPTCETVLDRDKVQETRRRLEQVATEAESSGREWATQADARFNDLIGARAAVRDLQSLIASLRVDENILAELVVLLGGAKEQREELQAICTDSQELVDKLKREVAFQDSLAAEIARLEREYAVASTSLAAIDERLLALGVEVVALKGEVAGLESWLKSTPGADVDGARQALQQWQTTHEELVRQTEELKAKKERLTMWRDQLVIKEKAEQGLADIGKKAQMLDTLREAINDAGPLVAERVMRRLSGLAQGYWSQLGKEEPLSWSGDFGLSVGERGYNQLSGGERVTAALAARMAIASHMADLDVLFLDEPTPHLDEETRSVLADLVSRLPVGQLIIVSHSDVFTPGADKVHLIGGQR